MIGKRTPHYCNTAPRMKETMVQTPHQAQTADDGFSLLELVVAVSIMLILGVVGFVAYQNYTDNARQAAAESVANQVLTSAVAAHNDPDGHPTRAVLTYNQHADDIVANITEASTVALEITAEDQVGTIAVARTAGNYSYADTTNYSEAGVTYSWAEGAHNSPSIKFQQGEEIARNLILNPRYKNNGSTWNVVEIGQDRNNGQLAVIPRGEHFSAMPDEPAVGDEVLHLTRNAPDDVKGSLYAKMDRPLEPVVAGYSHIGYTVPMQGRGKTWMYFSHEGEEVNYRAGQLEEVPRVEYENGGWVTQIDEIPDGAHKAHLMMGTPWEHSRFPDDPSDRDVYFGSPLLVVGHSEAEVREQLETYFDGDSQ